MKPLKHYVYTNEDMVKKYVDQLPKNRRIRHSRQTRKLKLSAFGQSYETSAELTKPEENFFDQLSILRSELLLQQRLSSRRPLRLEKVGVSGNIPEFVEETFVAHRVDLPVSGTGPIAGLQRLIFWISDQIRLIWIHH